MTRRKNNTWRRLMQPIRRAATSSARCAAWFGPRCWRVVQRRLRRQGPTIIVDARRRQAPQSPPERAQAAESRLTTLIVSERLVRLIRTSTGPRYVVQVPERVCPIPGWRSYSLLILTHDGDPDQRLTLYERIDVPPDVPDDRRAA